MNSLEAFFYVHEGLPRQGPGSEETSNALYEAAATETGIHTAVDLGAGPGSSAVFLARQGVNVTAVDKNVDFLSQLAASAAKVGVTQRIRVLNESMAAVDAIGGPFDLLWSEGTAYILGLSRALTLWSRLMKPESCLVLTDAFWLTNERSAGAVDFWSTEPNMLHVDDAPALFSRLGFAVTHQFLQPPSDWLDEYYDPLEKRSESLLDHTDSEVRQAASDAQCEIDIFRRYGDQYGHVAFVLRRSGN